MILRYLIRIFQVLNFVRVAVQSRKVNLVSIDRQTGDDIWLELPIDSLLQEFTVSVSGPKPNIEITDPNGRVNLIVCVCVCVCMCYTHIYVIYVC